MYNPYCGCNEYAYRNNNVTVNNPNNVPNDEIITLSQAIELIRTSVGDEREDEIFYDSLIKQAPTAKEKEIIISIRDDERKHNQILRKLYYNFTGQVIQVDESAQVTTGSNLGYKEQLEKALFGELNAVVKYRRIMGTMPNGESYTLLMSIMTDELRHASKYNFLIHNAK
jgi:rubrerythrin